MYCKLRLTTMLDERMHHVYVNVPQLGEVVSEPGQVGVPVEEDILKLPK